MITKEDIIKAQNVWSEGIIKMGEISNNRILLESYVSDFLDNVYNFQEKVLFKPTKAKIEKFRN
ncbi:MAG: hypothetical protein HOE36_02965, partial [Flavobacteriaceae bacterium]|nr:hypothetical protein [Flavobacteriaceae bacterium]MBT4222139.1 hypothetical protein [Cryomorphaceae bacterium]